jgi:hypothetical protein
MARSGRAAQQAQRVPNFSGDKLREPGSRHTEEIDRAVAAKASAGWF